MLWDEIVIAETPRAAIEKAMFKLGDKVQITEIQAMLVTTTGKEKEEYYITYKIGPITEGENK
jgi:hypothetical protein